MRVGEYFFCENMIIMIIIFLKTSKGIKNGLSLINFDK